MTKDEQVVIDVSKAVEKGFAVKVANDLTIGPVKDTASAEPRRWARKVEEYDGEPPQNTDGKSAQFWPIRELCGAMEENSGRARAKPCDKQLLVVRVKNQKWLADSGGYGGQVEYDEKDTRFYKYCPVHGPSPAGATKW